LLYIIPSTAVIPHASFDNSLAVYTYVAAGM